MRCCPLPSARKTVLVLGMLLGLAVFGATFTTDPVRAIFWISITLSGLAAALVWGAVFMTLWVYAPSDLWLWVFGLAWSFGFLGFWGPSTTLTAEVFPTRIRGVANGVVWFIGYFVGFVLWPFATVAVQQATGSFALAFQPYRFSWLRWPSACGLSCPSTPARSSGPRLASDYSKSGEWRSEVE